MISERGQASIELLAAIPFLVVLALICIQMLATGYAGSVADAAAEAGALALAAGLPAGPAVDAALPSWARERAELEPVAGGRVTVRLQPLSPLPGLARQLEVSSTAWGRP